MRKKEALPGFLSSFDELQQHIRAQLEDLSATDKGKKFAHFVQRIIPQTEFASTFDAPELNEKISNDGGVDLIANSRSDSSRLLIQAKLYVDRAENIDSILSKFQAYQAGRGSKNQNTLFDISPPVFKYLFVTLSPPTFINPSYAPTFERLYREDRLAYRCFMAILALCGAVNIDISSKESDPVAEVERIKSFLSQSRTILKGQPKEYIRYFKMAVKVWMTENLAYESEAEARRDMYLKSKRSNFSMMFKKLCMEADLSDKS